jgi:hypothetical protein
MPRIVGLSDSQATLATLCKALGPASVALLRNKIAFQMLLSLDVFPPALDGSA